MKTSIVIATFNKLDYTKQCIESIRQYTAAGSYEIIVVDNHSTDGSLDWLKAQPDIRFIANENNLGFPIACNQGMEIAVGDNILLLNNDTIVTARWLDNLLKCLYSREEIGAVGPITNYSINEQAVPVTYKTMDEMHQFADRCNQSNSSEWEERLTLVGFCVVFKKPVIDKIGLLDERFSPGNYEDDDYSYRIRQAGFEMMLCKDTYIHHYGSTSFRDNVAQYTKLLQTNQAKFIEKWGFDPEVSRLVHTELLDLMSLPEGGPFKVLELGCGSGGTLLRFKTRYPYAKCYGMEFNPNMAAFASLVADVHVGGLQDVGSKFAEGFFDAVILGETFLQSHSFIQALQTIKPLLKDNGELLASIPHLQHYSIVRNMINGTISREQMHAVTLSEMDGGFKQVGFSNVYITKYKLPMPEQEKQWLQQLRKMASTDLHEFWEVKTFFVRAKATARSSRVGKMVEQLLNDQDKEQVLTELLNFELGEIMQSIEAEFEQAVDIYNLLAISYYEMGIGDYILPYLDRAIALKPKDINTLTNLGFMLNLFGEPKSAYKWLVQIEAPDQAIMELIDEIHVKLRQQEAESNELKFLLRRIEFDVDREESVHQVAAFLQNREVSVEDINHMVSTHMIQQDTILNSIAAECYQRGLYEEVIPLLKQSYQYNSNNTDTLFNLGSILFDIKEFEQAYGFLSQIQEYDEEVGQMLEQIKGATTHER